LNPESGIEINEPITRPIPVSKNGGILESEVARAASDAHRTIAPIARRSALMKAKPIGITMQKMREN
jgi:hypothetical protein